MDVVHYFENILAATKLQGDTTQSATTFTDYLSIGKKIGEKSY